MSSDSEHDENLEAELDEVEEPHKRIMQWRGRHERYLRRTEGSTIAELDKVDESQKRIMQWKGRHERYLRRTGSSAKGTSHDSSKATSLTMRNSKLRVLHRPNKTFFNTSSLVNIVSRDKKQIASLRKNNRELAQELSELQNRLKTSEDTVFDLQRLLNLQVPKVISGNLKKMVGQIRSMLDVLNQTLCYCSNPETIGMDSTLLIPDLEKTTTPQNQGKMHCLYDGSENTRTRPVRLQQAKSHSCLTPIPEQSLFETSASFEEANGEPRITSKRSSNLSDKNSTRSSKSSELFDANVTRRTKSKGSSSSVIDHISVTPTEPLPTTPCFVDLERLPLPLLNMTEETQEVLAKKDSSLAEKHGPTQSCVDLEDPDDFTVKVPIDMELTMIRDTSTFNVDVPKEGNKKSKNLRVMKLILDSKDVLHSPEYQANSERKSPNREVIEEPVETIADRVFAKVIDPFAKSTKTKRTLIPPVKSPLTVEMDKTNENPISKPKSPTRLGKSLQVPNGGDAGTTSSTLSQSKDLITTVPVDYSEPSVSGVKRKGRLTYTVGVINSDDTSTSDNDSDYTEPSTSSTSSKQKVTKVKRGFENYRFFSNAKKKSSQRTIKNSAKQVMKDTTDIAKKSSPSIYDPTFKETPPDKVQRIAGKQPGLPQRKSRAAKTPVSNPSRTDLNDKCSLHSSSSDSSDSEEILEIRNVQENHVGSVTRTSPRKTFQSILDESSDNNSKDGDSNSDETDLEIENITVKAKEKEEGNGDEKEGEELEKSSIKMRDVSSTSNESESSDSDVSWRYQIKQKKKLPASSRRKPDKDGGNVTNGVHSKSKTAVKKNSKSGNQKQAPGNNTDQKRLSARGKKSGDTVTEPIERVSMPKTVNSDIKKPVTSDAGVSSVKLKKQTATNRKSRVSSKAIVDVNESDITTDNESVKTIDNGVKSLVSEPTLNSLSNRKKSVKAVGKSPNSKPELAKKMKLSENLRKGENDSDHNSESNGSSAEEEEKMARAKDSKSSNQNSPAKVTSSKKNKKNLFKGSSKLKKRSLNKKKEQQGDESAHSSSPSKLSFEGPSKLEKESLSNKKEQQSDKSPQTGSPRKLSLEDSALTKRRRANPVSYREVSLNKKLRRQL